MCTYKHYMYMDVQQCISEKCQDDATLYCIIMPWRCLLSGPRPTALDLILFMMLLLLMVKHMMLLLLLLFIIVLLGYHVHYLLLLLLLSSVLSVLVLSLSSHVLSFLSLSLFSTMWGPPVMNWFMNPMKTAIICVS